MHFESGRTVRTRNDNPEGHTRLPAYLRGRTGVVDRVVGRFPFPDSRALGVEAPAHVLYTVRFAGDEVFGSHCSPNVTILADLFEPYLEAV